MIKNCLPFLIYLPGDIFELKENLNDTALFRKFVSDLYDWHVKTFDSSNLRDLIDAYILEMRTAKQSNDSTDFTLEQIFSVVGDLFGAGAETVSTTLRWTVLVLLNFPDIQLRLHKAIDNVIPKDRPPSLDDKTNLPYAEAFIMEVQRFASVVPLSVPHCTLEDNVTFEGYSVPKNTSLILNLDSIFQDHRVFDQPKIFNPERFLDGSGNVLRPKALIPFGIGRRVCLGEAVARMELFLFITTMVKEFEFLPVESGDIPKLEGVVGIIHAPNPFKCRIVRRK